MESEGALDSEGGDLAETSAGDRHAAAEQSADGRFIRFREELGRSECKVIYRGLDLHTGCEISWHSISLQLVDQQDVPRIIEEMRKIARLDHPNIVRWKALWVCQQSGRLVLISELMPEGSLRQYLKKIKVPRERVLRQWTQQLLQALVYLHSLRPTPIIHNFLKPDSIYVIPNTGRVVIGGLCKSVIFRNAPLLLRRYEYMAPERQSSRPDPAADIYSLGMTILEICSQSQPYSECSSPEEVHRRTVTGLKPEALDRILNEATKDFIQECIRPVEERPSAQDLLQHRFITGKETRGDSNQPIRTKTRSVDFCDIEVPKGRMVDVQLVLIDEETRRTRKVGFSFDMDKDTPASVSHEMVVELHLPPALVPDLTLELTQWLQTSTNSPIKVRRPASKAQSSHKATHSEFDGSFFPIQKGASAVKLCKEEQCVSEETSSVSMPNSPERQPKLVHARRSVDGTPPLKSSLRFSSSANDESDVKLLQGTLNEIFGPQLLTTGIFGRKTEAFVKLFQEREGVPISGVVTRELWNAIWRTARSWTRTHELHLGI